MQWFRFLLKNLVSKSYKVTYLSFYIIEFKIRKRFFQHTREIRGRPRRNRNAIQTVINTSLHNCQWRALTQEMVRVEKRKMGLLKETNLVPKMNTKWWSWLMSSRDPLETNDSCARCTLEKKHNMQNVCPINNSQCSCDSLISHWHTVQIEMFPEPTQTPF